MIYRFSEFELDDEHYELRHRNEVRPLPRKGFDLLRFLLTQAGRVVGKEEIFDEIWPSLAVSENVLPVTVRTIRRALDDGEGELLRTVRGRGYCIVCEVYHADADAPRPATALPSQVRSFVGRLRVMHMLQTQLMLASEGDGIAVLISGEAGIGKSRTLHELARWARGRTPFVFQVPCHSIAGAPAFWPLIRVMTQAERLTPPIGREVEESTATSGTGLSDLLNPQMNRGLSSAEVRFRFARGFLHLIQEMSRAHPVVLVLDDLDAADEDTLHVVDSIVREIATERVLLVASHRSAERRTNSEASRVMGAIARAAHVEQVTLSGLDEASVGQLIREEAGLDGAPQLVRALHEKTEGNPFFVRETVRWLMQEGRITEALDVETIGLPATVRDVILRRLAGVSPECERLMSWAAVAGRSFTVPLLERVTGLDNDSVLRQLSDAENAGIITSRESSGQPRRPGEYGFTHALIAETLYYELPAPERVRRHRDVAEALSAMSGRSTRERLDELAHHFFHAAPAGEIDRATLYLTQAAERALGAFAFEDAIRYQRNRLVAEELRAPRDDHRYCAALIALGDALTRSDRYTEAENAFVQAVELARDIGDATFFAEAALGVARNPFRRVGSEGQEDPTRVSAASLLAAARTQLGDSGDVTLRSRVLAALARCTTHDLAGSASLAARAAHLARSASSQEALFDAIMAQHAALLAPKQIEERLALANEAVELALAMDASPWLSQAYSARIPLLIAVGNVRAADADIESLAALAERLRLPSFSYNAARFELARAVGSGRFADSKQMLERVIRLGRETGDRGIGWLGGTIGLFLLAFSASAETIGRSLASLAATEFMDGPTGDAFAAHFSMATGDRAVCAERLQKATEGGLERYPRNEDWLWNLSLLSDVAAFVGDVPRSEKLYELLLPYAHLNVVNRHAGYRGSLESVLARLAMVQEDLPLARTHMESAIEFNRRLGAPVTVLINRFHLSVILAQGDAKDRREARLVLKEVTAEASRVGIRAYIDRMTLSYPWLSAD